MKLLIKIFIASIFILFRLSVFAKSSYPDSSKKFSYVDTKQLDKIFFSPKEDTSKTFQVNEVIVTGNRINFLEKLNPSIYELNISESPFAENQSLGNTINFISGVFVKSYGAEGSLQTLSFRGISSEYSNVIFNGMNLSNSLSGTTDLSKFSIEHISDINIIKGNFFEPFESTTFGNLICINSFSDSSSKNNIKFVKGSFGYKSISGSYYKNFSNTSANISINHKSADNDFDYTYEGKQYKRFNSDFRQTSLNVGLTHNFNLFYIPTKIQIHSLISTKEQGLPGFVASNNHSMNKTRQNERELILSSKFMLFLSSQLSTIANVGFAKNRSVIYDPERTINFQIDQFELISSDLSFNVSSLLESSSASISFGMNGNLQNVKTNEFENEQLVKNPNLSRSIYNVFTNSNISLPLNFGFISELTFKSAFTYNYSIIESKQNSVYQTPQYKLGIELDLTNEKIFKLFSNYGKGFRLPNFYEILYSQIDAIKKSSLKNEKISEFEFGLQSKWRDLNIEFVYFSNTITDKIVWYPQRIAIFSPRNIGKVTSKGIEIRHLGNFLNEIFSYDVSYTLTDAVKSSRLSESDNTFGKQLIYQPKHKISSTLTGKLFNFNLMFQSNFFSERFYSEDNDPAYVLPKVFLLDAHINYINSYSEIKFLIQLSIINLTNQNYFLIQSYPMPGREFRFTIKMEY